METATALWSRQRRAARNASSPAWPGIHGPWIPAFAGMTGSLSSSAC